KVGCGRPRRRPGRALRGRYTERSPRQAAKEGHMAISPLAGKPAPADLLIDVAGLERDYFQCKPDPGDPNQLVSFGTSGHRGVTPTPVISRAILVHNRGRKGGLADGIIITPSHNPPEDGGFKYNPPNGGPADTDATRWIQDRANALLRADNAGVKRVPLASALGAATTRQEDFVLPYVSDLRNVIDMDAI